MADIPTKPRKPTKDFNNADKLYKQLAAGAYDAGNAKFSEDSAKWFFNKIKYISMARSRTFIISDINQEGESPDKAQVGSMYTYVYSAKHWKTLPYFDKLPLIFMVEPYDNGFLGINLHYLPPKIRALFMYRLLSLANNKRYDESTRLKLSYQLLKVGSTRAIMKPCLKRYLYDHIRSPVLYIPASEWEPAIMLRTQSFTKAYTKVWKDSLAKIGDTN